MNFICFVQSGQLRQFVHFSPKTDSLGPHIWLGSKTNKEPICVGGVDILQLVAVRDLGVVLDSNLTMKHVEGIVCSCIYQLRQLKFAVDH